MPRKNAAKPTTEKQKPKLDPPQELPKKKPRDADPPKPEPSVEAVRDEPKEPEQADDDTPQTISLSTLLLSLLVTLCIALLFPLCSMMGEITSNQVEITKAVNEVESFYHVLPDKVKKRFSKDFGAVVAPQDISQQELARQLGKVIAGELGEVQRELAAVRTRTKQTVGIDTVYLEARIDTHMEKAKDLFQQRELPLLLQLTNNLKALSSSPPTTGSTAPPATKPKAPPTPPTASSGTASFQPYVIPDKINELDKNDLKQLLEHYISWHNQQLADTTIRCQDRKFLLFRPMMSISDSLGAMSGGIQCAVNSGRLLMVEWPRLFRMSIIPPNGMMWDWKDAEAAGLACDSLDNVEHLDGHSTQDSFCATVETNSKFQYGLIWEYLASHIMQPSAAIQAAVQSNKERLIQSKSHEVKNIVGVQMRTGGQETELWSTLRRGDEIGFQKCVEDYLGCTYGITPQTTALFLSTDTPEIYNALCDNWAICSEHEPEILEKLPTSPHVEISLETAQSVIGDWFTFKNVEALFTTEDSPFARTAIRLGEVDRDTETPVFDIAKGHGSRCMSEPEPCFNG